MRSHLLVPVLAALVAVPLLSGCEEAATESRSVYVPATVHEVEGSLTKKVTFTARGAEEVDLAFATSRKQGDFTSIPYASLVYDGEGVSWVYVSPAGLVFQRVRIEVARIEGDEVLLTSGLAPGSRVVTVGAAEVYGAELGIAGKH